MEVAARDKGYWFVLAALLVSVAVVVVLAFVPLGASVEEYVAETRTEVTEDGEPQVTVDRRQEVERNTLADTDGWGVVLALGAGMLVLSGLPLLIQAGRLAFVVRATSTVLLTVGMVVAMSLSVFIFPVALLMLIATGLALADRRTTTPRSG